MEPRNTYIKDLEFGVKGTQNLKFQDDSGKYLAAQISITKMDEDKYDIDLMRCDDKQLTKKIARQLCTSSSEDDCDMKLKVIQYWTRKFIADNGELIQKEILKGDKVKDHEGSSEDGVGQQSETESEESASVSDGDMGDEGEQGDGDSSDGQGKGESDSDGDEGEQKESKQKPKRKTKSKEQKALEKEMQEAAEDEEELSDKLEAMKKVIEDKIQDEHNKDQHFKFPLVLKAIRAGVNVALVGPAGSGKTTVVVKVAEKLGLKFYSKSVSAQTGSHEFFGYQDANGKYIRTLFREAYEDGGVFLLDEFDAGNPNVLAALNQATANDTCSFADGMVPKHKDFIVVMAGNTFGHGATSEYVGRNKIDAATLDRFAFIQFPYDEDFEMRLATNKEWCKEVQSIREVVNRKKIKTIVSPRATFEGAKLLSVGVSKGDVLHLMIYKGLTEQEIRMIKG